MRFKYYGTYVKTREEKGYICKKEEREYRTKNYKTTIRAILSHKHGDWCTHEKR